MDCLEEAYITPAHIPWVTIQLHDHTSQQGRLTNVV